jgi:signal transduction histidine kinase
MSRAEPFLRRYAVDALVVAAAVAAGLQVALQDDPLRAPHTALWFAVPAIVLTVLPLLARRAFPFAAPAAVWLLGGAVAFVDGALVAFAFGAYLAALAASFLLGSVKDVFQARAGLAITLAGAAAVVYNHPRRSLLDFVFIPALFVVAWIGGAAVRSRAEQAEHAEQRAVLAERERESAARIAVAEERARITRELHDIVAHAVSVMVLQVGAVRHNLPDEHREDKQALRGVEQAGRAALAEMRRLLGAMHDGDRDVELTPHPGLHDLEALVAKVRSAGLQVELHREGNAVPLPHALDLSAYRIVQEGLTNALKHAGASRADVTVRYADGRLQIEVRDDGAGGATNDGLGHGLVGIRERVKIYGGEMTASVAPEGGYVLSARLPLDRGPA